jgi:hypothetical protein
VPVADPSDPAGPGGPAVTLAHPDRARGVLVVIGLARPGPTRSG